MKNGLRRYFLAAIVAVPVCAGCTAPSLEPVSIRFEARANANRYSCDPAAAKTEDGSVVTTLAFFIHDIALVDERGGLYQVTLDDDAHWQSDGVALLDFEDGSGVCKNGTPGIRRVVAGTVESGSGNVTGIEFSVGVPFALNHGDPAKATGPLAGTRMHWSWRGGYKFLRLDGNAAAGPGFRVHVGSTGCEGRITDIVSCKRPNVARISLAPFDPSADRVIVDLDHIFDGSARASETVAKGCMGEADEPGCAAVFSALGLELSSGRPQSEQKLFVRETGNVE